MKRFLAGLTLGAAALAAMPAAAQNIAITNAKIAAGTGAAPVEGTVIVRNGRIASVGAGAAPAGMEVLDAEGAWVTPGLVAPYSQLGIVEIGGVSQTNDTEAEDSPYSASLDVALAVNPNSTGIAVSRLEGLTRAATAPSPSNDLFGGQGAVIELKANDPDLVVKPRAFQMIALGEAGARYAGGGRLAVFTRLKDAFGEAQAFARNPNGYDFGRSEDSLLTRSDAEALVDVIEGRTPAMISVDRASDIRAALTLKEDYPRMRMILLGAAEGWLVADEIAAAGVPVITTPMQNLPSRFESIASTQSNAGRLVAAGVQVALSDIGNSTVSPRLAQEAGQTVAQGRIPGAAGLTHEQALAAITSVPVDILGLEAGRLIAGAAGDVVVWDGDPLETRSAPTAVFIDGVRQPMTSRQTELRDRYNPAAADTNLPPQYSRSR